ncbi:MAG: hypothetical protein RJB38_1826, partial [Pseudomonadota bacterium]
RSEDLFVLGEALSGLLDRGMLLALVSGTSRETIEPQLLHHIPAQLRVGLTLCTHRGSEVYSFDASGAAQLRFCRQATADENLALDRVAIDLQSCTRSEFGVESAVILNRVNRRKLDLLPQPEWASPRKAESQRLFEAIEERFKPRDGRPGLEWLIHRARELGLKYGLPHLRITTDLKHLELGLTDKGDSAAWFLENVLFKQGVALSQVVIFGDEFGSLGGISGSDQLMRLEELESALTVSVGVEPGGVPNGVTWFPGGPEVFRDFLDLQLAHHEWGRSRDSAWLVEQQKFESTREREMEAIFTIGNGALGVRGGLDIELPSAQAELYLAGVYDAKALRRPYSESELYTPARTGGFETELVSLPFPFRLKLRCGGQVLAFEEGGDHEVQRCLDLSSGVLHLDQAFQLPEGKVRIVSRRVASLSEGDLLLQEVEISSDAPSLLVEYEIGVDFSDFHLRHPHLLVIHPQGKPPWNHRGVEALSEIVELETQNSGLEIVMTSQSQVNLEGMVGRGGQAELRAGTILRIRRVVTVADSRDVDAPRPMAPDARERWIQARLERSRTYRFQDWHRSLARHRREWRKFWRIADVSFAGTRGVTEAQRFNSYHLRASAPFRSDVSIPARTLSGRGYEGHVFWDAEVFMLPFFVFQEPALARRMLEYRHATLNGARKRARDSGCLGASFAWESTVTGQDVTPQSLWVRSLKEEVPVYTGTQQIHVTAAVAYGIWKYWQCTADADFMLRYGVEILWEGARFWVSRGTSRDHRIHIDRVVGPDEYHHDVNDNAFTNWMARFHVEKALWAADWLLQNDPRELVKIERKIGLQKQEFESWRKFVQALVVPVPGDRGVIEQFAGFFDLDSIKLDPSELFRVPVGRLIDWRQINLSRICKQADVLMLPFLFPEEFSSEVIRANLDYYEPITDHASSLSPPVFSFAWSMVGESERAVEYYLASV